MEDVQSLYISYHSAGNGTVIMCTAGFMLVCEFEANSFVPTTKNPKSQDSIQIYT